MTYPQPHLYRSVIYIYLEHDSYLCLCYVVPEQSSRQSMIELDTFDRLLYYIVHLDHENTNIHLVICGDMNARISYLMKILDMLIICLMITL